MIIDIRGTNGSGKSYPIHQILKEHAHEVRTAPTSVAKEPCVPYTFVPSLNLAVIGEYKTACGGADGVTSQQAICDAIRFLALQPTSLRVVVEGSIVASVFSRWYELAIEMEDKGVPYVFLFLDTPIEKCVQQVVARRQANDNFKSFDPDKTLKPRAESIERIKQRLLVQPREVLEVKVGILDHTRSTEQLLDLIQNGWPT